MLGKLSSVAQNGQVIPQLLMKANRNVPVNAMIVLIVLIICGLMTKDADFKKVAKRQWMGTLTLSHTYAKKVYIFFIVLLSIYLFLADCLCTQYTLIRTISHNGIELFGINVYFLYKTTYIRYSCIQFNIKIDKWLRNLFDTTLIC